MTEQLPFRVLAVCTGNISRSPVVERLMAAKLGPYVTVCSAGIGAVVGHPIDPPMARLLVAAGGDVGDFRARQVTASLVRNSELVLALSSEHRAYVVDLVPGIVRRTFTLLEFARLASGLDRGQMPSAPSERLRMVVGVAAELRRWAPRAPGERDDVPDPFGSDEAAYVEAFGLIRDATRTIVDIALG